MKFYERSLQALLSSAPRGFAARSRVLASLASLAQIGELSRRLELMSMKASEVIVTFSLSVAKHRRIAAGKGRTIRKVMGEGGEFSSRRNFFSLSDSLYEFF